MSCQAYFRRYLCDVLHLLSLLHSLYLLYLLGFTCILHCLFSYLHSCLPTCVRAHVLSSLLCYYLMEGFDTGYRTLFDSLMETVMGRFGLSMQVSLNILVLFRFVQEDAFGIEEAYRVANLVARRFLWVYWANWHRHAALLTPDWLNFGACYIHLYTKIIQNSRRCTKAHRRQRALGANGELSHKIKTWSQDVLSVFRVTEEATAL